MNTTAEASQTNNPTEKRIPKTISCGIQGERRTIDVLEEMLNEMDRMAAELYMLWLLADLKRGAPRATVREIADQVHGDLEVHRSRISQMVKGYFDDSE